jgi:hypothetical protein
MIALPLAARYGTKVFSDDDADKQGFRSRFMRHAISYKSVVARAMALIALTSVWAGENASAAPFIRLIWARAGAIELGDANMGSLTTWSIRTTDTDESLKNTSLAALPAFTTTLSFSDEFGGFDLSTLDGDVITRLPHDLDAGTWAYGIGLYEGIWLRSYAQVRLAGSTATVQHSSMAEFATSLGLWTSPDDYIEFDPSHAVLIASGPATGPTSFHGEPMPEPSSFALSALALLGVQFTRVRMRK